MDYTGLDIWKIQNMPIDIYLFFMREAFIYENLQTEVGKEYLENCWRIEQTEPERKKLREKFSER